MPRMSVARSLDRVSEAFVSDRHIARAVSRAVKTGKLRKLASRLYTRNLIDPPETIVARNSWDIVAKYFPGRSRKRRYSARRPRGADIRNGERQWEKGDDRFRGA